MQYTIRGIPAALDQALRQRARDQGKSLNDMVIEALGEGLGFGNGIFQRRDLTDIVGTWKKDVAFDSALADQDEIDESIWK